MAAWKDLERHVAKTLGGVRLLRGGDFSESIPDVIVDAKKLFPRLNVTEDDTALAVECKYRSNQPWVNKYKAIISRKETEAPFTIVMMPCTNGAGMEDNLCICPLDHFQFLYAGKHRLIRTYDNIPGYIQSYVDQSYTYCITPEYRNRTNVYYNLTLKQSLNRIVVFKQLVPLVVLGKKNDSTRLCLFYESEYKRLLSRGNQSS